MQTPTEMRDDFFALNGNLSSMEGLYDATLPVFNKARALYDDMVQSGGKTEDSLVKSFAAVESTVNLAIRTSQYHRANIDKPLCLILWGGIQLGAMGTTPYAHIKDYAQKTMQGYSDTARQLLVNFCIEKLYAAIEKHQVQIVERCKRLPSIAGDAVEMDFVDLSKRHSPIPRLFRCCSIL